MATLVACLTAHIASSAPLRRVEDLRHAVLSDVCAAGTKFDISATVVLPSTCGSGTIVLGDATNFVSAIDSTFKSHATIRPGAFVRISGYVVTNSQGICYAVSKELTVLGERPVPQLVTASISEINREKYPDWPLVVYGLVTEAFIDEIDPNFIFLTLAEGHEITRLAIPFHGEDKATIERLVGARIRATVHCSGKRHTGARALSGLEISCTDLGAVQVIRPAPDDPFDVPVLCESIRSINDFQSSDLSRKRVSGQVIAVCAQNVILVQDARGNISKIRLSGDGLPAYGQAVDAVGIPETDLYHLNLSRAIWRAAAGATVPQPPPETVTAEKMLTNRRGSPQIKVRYHGKPIRLRGKILALPAVRFGDCRLNVDCNGFTIPVDATSVPQALDGLEPGCVIDASGTCVMDVESWRPQSPIPHINGFSIALRTRDDIRVVSRPPWWTPRRLLLVILSLLALLAVIAVWNRILRRLVERRSRQLLREQIAHALADMRTEERTRLAVELHDTISQNLTGATMQIDAAQKLLDKNREKTVRHLEIASKTLTSCREELRNCIWDLRHRTLETHVMNDAIRRTLQQHTEGVELDIRFNVPRKSLTDNVTHALLCILRELSVNAVRHGRATRIRIAGALDGELLKFSVTDNGDGFDPEARPGMAQGHFGLQGIQERLKQFGGSLEISSSPGRGAKFTATLHLPHKDQQP